MTSLVTGLRNLILKSGYSVTRTINAVVTSKIIKSDIHTDQIIFKDPQHMNTEVKRQDAFKAVVEFARLTGLDDAGAVFAEIAGGAHDKGSGVDQFWRLTTTIKDKDGVQMLFYRDFGKEKWWKRPHIPMIREENEALWKDIKEHPEKYKYIRVSQKQFDAKKL